MVAFVQIYASGDQTKWIIFHLDGPIGYNWKTMWWRLHSCYFCLLKQALCCQKRIHHYLHNVSNIDDKSVRQGFDRNPYSFFPDLESLSFIDLEENCNGISIRMRVEPHHKLGLWAWRVIVHPHSLAAILKQLIYLLCLHPQSSCH